MIFRTRIVETHPGFSVCHPGRDRFYIQPPILELFFSFSSIPSDCGAGRMLGSDHN